MASPLRRVVPVRSVSAWRAGLMPTLPRSWRGQIANLAALALVALVAPLAPAAELRNFDDACLRAVHFADDREGWAVGDEGTVWHSIDGGKSWERQPTGTRASLRSVCFLDPYVGWVAGREEIPGVGSAGVLLFTDDGGLKWRRILTNAVPGLNAVRFIDEKTGYLLGDATDHYPTGIFITKDGGRHWQPVRGPRATSWLAAAHAEKTRELVVAGAWNRLGRVEEQLALDDIDSLGGRNVKGVALAAGGGIAVGQGGLVLTSDG